MLLYALAQYVQGNGVSSNGRTAVSGAVCEGSTPSTPAISHHFRFVSHAFCSLFVFHAAKRRIDENFFLSLALSVLQ